MRLQLQHIPEDRTGSPDNIRKPHICSLYLLEHCCLRCKMCVDWKNEPCLPEISLEEWGKFFLSLKQFVDEPIEISLTGGEPLIYKDIFAMIKMIGDLGFSTFLNSSGYLINRSIAKKIVEAKLRRIGLSLDSLDSNTHDYLRGVEGVLEKVMSAIKYLKELDRNLSITIMTIIMGKNIYDILPLARWVQESSDINYINFQVIMQPFRELPDEGWFQKDKYKELWPQDIDKACSILDSLIKLKESGFNKICNSVSQIEVYKRYFRNPNNCIQANRACHYLDSQIWINPQGKIYLCAWKGPIGDMHHDIKEVYYSDKAQEVRSQIISCKENCHQLVNCNYEA